MPSKKRKYNARFPAGRIKKIMQTDEEVGKVAQAVPIIISRTLELFVGSLLSKAMQVTMSRNAKTLSPSHVKQCILAESRFDFLRDLVKNVPDVSAAEEKETMSAESSPNASRHFRQHLGEQNERILQPSDSERSYRPVRSISRFSEVPGPPRRVVREDSNSSSSCDTRAPAPPPAPAPLKRALSSDTELPHRPHRTETITSTIVSADVAIDLSKRERPVRSANFYQETLTDEISHKSVITLNPTYTSPQPSTSYTSMTTVPPLQRLDTVPKQEFFVVDNTPPATPMTPVTPILNIDFTKNLSNPEIKVLDTAVASIVGVKEARSLKRQNSKPPKVEHKKIELKPLPSQPVDIDHLNSGNLQIDEDYDT